MSPRRKKALGQHHLREGSLCRPLIEFLFAGLPPVANQVPYVVEIGPGGGVLTAELLRAGADVLALELDPAEKHAVSHRGRAFRTLVDGIRVVEQAESSESSPSPGNRC